MLCDSSPCATVRGSSPRLCPARTHAHMLAHRMRAHAGTCTQLQAALSPQSDQQQCKSGGITCPCVDAGSWWLQVQAFATCVPPCAWHTPQAAAQAADRSTGSRQKHALPAATRLPTCLCVRPQRSMAAASPGPTQLPHQPCVSAGTGLLCATCTSCHSLPPSFMKHSPAGI